MKEILVFIFIFCVIVIVHELGHFIFAKMSGILVREFSIGMGPKLFSHQGKDGTTYTIRILPVGGYVRMAGLGEDVTEIHPGQPLSVELDENQRVVRINTSSKVQLPNSVPMEVSDYDLEDALFIQGVVYGQSEGTQRFEVDHDATIIEEDGTEVRIAPTDVQFQSAKLYKRMLTNFAGPLFNLILTFVLFLIIMFAQGGLKETDVSSRIGGVVENGIAEKAGVQAEDRIISIAGNETKTFEDIRREVNKNAGKKVNVVIDRDGSEIDMSLTPKIEKAEDGSSRGMIGIQSGVIFTKLSFIDTIKEAGRSTVKNATLIFVALKDLVSNFSLNKLGGPVMIFQASAQVADQDFITILSFMAFLSVNLGIMNLLPIPALDGGKIILNILEGIRRKPLSPESEGKITIVGFAFLMILMVLVTWNDIMRFFFR